MKKFPQFYADISVIHNPQIPTEEKFVKIIKLFLDNGLEDRLMFGAGNGDIKQQSLRRHNLHFSRGNNDKKYSIGMLKNSSLVKDEW